MRIALIRRQGRFYLVGPENRKLRPDRDHVVVVGDASDDAQELALSRRGATSNHVDRLAGGILGNDELDTPDRGRAAKIGWKQPVFCRR
jgi:hypothetical protein